MALHRTNLSNRTSASHESYTVLAAGFYSFKLNTKMDTLERKERREQRIQTLINCQTPTDLAFNIWTKQMEEAIGSSRDHYRNPFINWIESYKSKTIPQWTSYKTPRDLANGIWKPFLDSPDDYGLFSDLRNALVDWIENYALSS